MIPFEKLNPIHQKKYLKYSGGITIDYPDDFIYKDTSEGHAYWWDILKDPYKEIKYLR